MIMKFTLCDVLNALAVLSVIICFAYYQSNSSSWHGQEIFGEFSSGAGERANAVIVILAKSSDLDALFETLPQFEHTFNYKFNYPYVFLNDQPFDETFKRGITQLLMDRYNDPNGQQSTRNVSFGLIPSEHWSYPVWISQEEASKSRKKMAESGVSHGDSESYRHMSRFWSGFFYRHPLLEQYDYFWRVESGARYTCGLNQDPFVFMQKNGIEFGFSLMKTEFMASVVSLWPTTKSFLQEIYATLNNIQPPQRPALPILMDNEDLSGSKVNELLSILKSLKIESNSNNESAEKAQKMLDSLKWNNGWHFWSNFEIASFKFFRSPQYQSYFDYLDKFGGFYYERWGDAPVHSLAVGLFLEMSQVHHFKNIGYTHGSSNWCPVDGEESLGKCFCNPLDQNNAALSDGAFLKRLNYLEK